MCKPRNTKGKGAERRQLQLEEGYQKGGERLKIGGSKKQFSKQALWETMLQKSTQPQDWDWIYTKRARFRKTNIVDATGDRKTNNEGA